MLAVEGIYENGQIHFLEKLPTMKRARVIVTIIETFQESDTDQKNTYPHIFDDLIGAIDACEDGSVRHNHHINALTAFAVENTPDLSEPVIPCLRKFSLLRNKKKKNLKKDAGHYDCPCFGCLFPDCFFAA